jgi:hypothetical protein
MRSETTAPLMISSNPASLMRCFVASGAPSEGWTNTLLINAKLAEEIAWLISVRNYGKIRSAAGG